MTFITAGLGHDSFTKKHPSVKPFYNEDLIEKSDRKFGILLSSSIGLMLAGIMWMVGSSALPLPAGCTRSLYTAVFFVIIAVSITVMTYAAMQKDKYDIEKYNKVNSKEAKEQAKKNEENPLVGKICGSLFLLSVTAYLIMGFMWHLWSAAWIVFLIFIVMCALCALIFSKNSKG